MEEDLWDYISKPWGAHNMNTAKVFEYFNNIILIFSKIMINCTHTNVPNQVFEHKL